ncbi:MAG: serine/threonine protein kinase [Rhodocyclaceae bacterium]|nr:serine/threonine protein kinase [Rhodocyclaceae bacterium]
MLGRYRLERMLGKGAMGIVYKAFDSVIARPVALKTIQKDRLDDNQVEDALARFRQEARAAGRLVHPNIVQVYDFGETGDTAFIAMEYVEGCGLREYLNIKQHLSLAEAGRLISQVLDALAYAHGRGIVHRDIKPANLLVTPSDMVKVTDFGIAHMSDSHLTQIGAVMGTPSYMAPEQFMGRQVDGRADVYSAGVVLYELLTNHRPFEGPPAALALQIVNEIHRPPSTHNPQLGPAIDAVMDRALAKAPEDRYVDARTFSRSLHAAIDLLEAREMQDADEDTTIVLHVHKEPGSAETSIVTDWGTVNLKPLTDMLTRSVGPVASKLVQRITEATNDPTEFTTRLAKLIDDQGDRKRFVDAAHDLLLQTHPHVVAATKTAPTMTRRPATLHAPPVKAVDAAFVDSVVAALLPHLGPIAKVLAKKGAQQFTDQTMLVRAMAEHIDHAAARADFLARFGLH